MGWNYLSIPKLQRLHCWSLGINIYFIPTYCNGCNYSSMLRLKFIHVSLFLLLTATKQLYEWYFLSVCPSVTPFQYISIIVSLWNFQELSPMTRWGQVQRSKVKVTEVKTQLNRFRTVTPVWIHWMMMKWCTTAWRSINEMSYCGFSGSSVEFQDHKLGVSGL